MSVAVAPATTVASASAPAATLATSSTKNETTKISIAIATSLLVGATAMTLVSTELLPPFMIAFLIPVSAYIISFLMSIIYQYSACRTVQIGTIAISDLIIGGTTGLASFLLFMESVPIFRYMFGTYAPRSPITGLPYSPDSAEYVAAMQSENHYKLQFFSGIVKAVIPMYLSEQVKSGLVYLYWMFWMTLLPLYFVLSVQGVCS